MNKARLVPYEMNKEVSEKIKNHSARVASIKEGWLDRCIRHVAPAKIYKKKGRSLGRWLEHHNCDVRDNFDINNNEFKYTFWKGDRRISTLKVKLITNQQKDEDQ